ncbi:MAG: Gx transporter family protein [Clostridiales Family XIII bacterium]|jgi:heptaprenyl diphosphate synthase|nr:Gx transporter family protein [Clostridiales Family XIII bacterium]
MGHEKTDGMMKRHRPQRSASARGEVALTGIFLAFILVVGLVERMFPLDFIVPGARLGLSNVVVLTSIYLFRFRVTLLLVVLKCVILSMLTGGPSSFIYSIFGSMLSFLVMWLLVRLFSGSFSPVGISVAGAACHSTGQVLAACLLLENAGMFLYLPLLLILGTCSGVLVGVVVKQAVPRLRTLQKSGAAGSILGR